MNTNQENKNFAEMNPPVAEASAETLMGVETNPESKFDSGITEVKKQYATGSEKWVSRIGNLFSGGAREKKSKENTSPSFMSKIKNTLNKGMDWAVEKSVAFRDGGIDVTRAYDFFAKDIPKGADKFAEWSHTFATTGNDYPDFVNKRPQMMTQMAEEHHDVEVATVNTETLQTPEALDTAKMAIEKRAEQVLGFGVTSVQSGVYEGQKAKNRKNMRLNNMRLNSMDPSKGVKKNESIWNRFPMMKNKVKAMEQFEKANEGQSIAA